METLKTKYQVELVFVSLSFQDAFEREILKSVELGSLNFFPDRSMEDKGQNQSHSCFNLHFGRSNSTELYLDDRRLGFIIEVSCHLSSFGSDWKNVLFYSWTFNAGIIYSTVNCPAKS